MKLSLELRSKGANEGTKERGTDIEREREKEK